jgi:hypothetical protein
MTATSKTETYYTIRKKVQCKLFTFEEAFVALAKIGSCPNLLNDDAGRWAVCFDGFQSVADIKATDITTTFFVDKKRWKPTPMKALLHALKD